MGNKAYTQNETVEYGPKPYLDELCKRYNIHSMYRKILFYWVSEENL